MADKEESEKNGKSGRRTNRTAEADRISFSEVTNNGRFELLRRGVIEAVWREMGVSAPRHVVEGLA